MSTVLLVGAFGQGNPGDEALCAAFCSALADHEVVVASSDPIDTASRHGVRAVPGDALPTARAAIAADLLVIAGGTIFKTLHPSTGRRPTALLRNAVALVAGARARGTKVAMVGVGADDLRGRPARGLARWLVRHVDLLILRDEESAAVLADAGAPAPFWIGADPAWVLAGDTAVAGPLGGPSRTVTIALSHLAGDDQMLANLAAAVRPSLGTYSVQLQPWQVGAQGRDADFAETLRELLSTDVKVLDPPDSLATAAVTFGDDDLVIGLRFHALVAAAMAGTRFLAVAHEPKLAGLARRLGQVSVPAHASADVLRGAVVHALEHDPVSPVAVAAEVDAARRSLDLMRLLLDAEASGAAQDVAGLALSDGAGSW